MAEPGVRLLACYEVWVCVRSWVCAPAGTIVRRVFQSCQENGKVFSSSYVNNYAYSGTNYIKKNIIIIIYI